MISPLIPLSAAPRIPWLPRRPEDKLLHVSTFWRWTQKGLRARDGTRVRLRSLRVGDTLCTTEEWLREFFEALTSHDPGLAAATAPPRSPAARRRSHAQATKKLEELGL